jgi:3-mercaptopyruvate sulfurtransferase SseA
MTRKPQATQRATHSTAVLVVSLFIIAGGLVLIAASFFPAASVATPTPPPPTHAAEETYPEIPRVDLAAAKAAFDAQTAVFVDVRDGGSYAADHIPGALSIPLAELENRLGELKPADWIITYCT